MSLSNLITIISSNITSAISGYKYDKIEKKSDSNFFNKISKYSFWKNTVETSIPRISDI